MTKEKKEQKEINESSDNEIVDDIVFEDENINDTQIVKKLRDRLRKCEAEKKEYLDGWQRTKADLLNVNKDIANKVSRAGSAGKETLASELLPVLDSFDMAFKGEAWNNVDDVWQKGIEYIHTQLLDVLASHGVEQFGKVGDIFDPNIHEATAEKEGTDHAPQTITEILQSGYKTKEAIIRPARVIVAK